MEFITTGMAMEVLEGDGKPRLNLKIEVGRALREALAPIEVPGLSAVYTIWVYPPAKRVRAPAMQVVRYSASKKTATCRFMMSPELSVNDPKWDAYRIAYVRQAQSMMKNLLETLQKRLQEKHHDDADLQSAIKASIQALEVLAHRYGKE